MVQYSLVKPKVSGVEEDEDLPEEPKGLDFSSPWRASFLAAREEIKRNLHILHPSQQSILSICQSDHYANLLLVDLSNVRNEGAIECEHLLNDITIACTKSKEVRLSQSYSGIFYFLRGSNRQRITLCVIKAT